MTAAELIRTIRRGGGSVAIALDGERLYVRVPRDEGEALKPQLRAMKPEIVALLRQQSEVLFDVPCNCDEKPHPHYRHFDGTGPGSGHTLEPHNSKQVHARRR